MGRGARGAASWARHQGCAPPPPVAGPVRSRFLHPKPGDGGRRPWDAAGRPMGGADGAARFRSIARRIPAREGVPGIGAGRRGVNTARPAADAGGGGIRGRGRRGRGGAGGGGRAPPSYRQIWMADGVSAAGPDMLAAAAAAKATEAAAGGGGSRAQVSGGPGAE